MSLTIIKGTILSAPALGQDNEAVYEDVFGVSPERLAELKDQGVI